MTTSRIVLKDSMIGPPGADADDLAIDQLEGVPMVIFGDSYTRYAPPENTPGPRIAKRHRMLEPENFGVAGTKCSEIYQKIEAEWTPNSRGLVVIGSATINNVRLLSHDANGYMTGAEAFRACLAYLSSRDVRAAGDTGTPFRFGPGWASDQELDGWTTGAEDAYVDVAWQGTAPLDVFVWCRFDGDGGGVLTAIDETGATLASIDTDGYDDEFTGVMTVPGQGAGEHTVRLVASVGDVTIRRAGARAANPPLIVWDKPGPILLGLVPTVALRDANEVMQDVADDFANVVTCDNDVAGWATDTMIVDDLAHRNDRGNTFAADTMEAALRAGIDDFEQGLNAVGLYTADATYFPPTAAYQADDAAVPNAPVLAAFAANQIRLTYTEPNDNGATIQSYELQHRTTAGPGAWTSSSGPLTGAGVQGIVLDSGLTPATSYDFRIRAKNAIGDSAWSATATAVAGAVPNPYSSDAFGDNSPISLGNADVGGAWTAYNSAWAVEGQLAVLKGKTTANLWAHATVTDAQKDGYVKAVVMDHAGSAAGVIMCCNSATAPTLAVAVVSYIPTGQYALMFQTNGTTWVVWALFDIVPQVGDEVGIHKAGNVYTPVINGQVQTSYSAGLADLTSTRHGLISFAVGAKFDNYSHTNVDPTA